MCPDCTTFDARRSRALNKGEVSSRGCIVSGTSPGHVQRNSVSDDLTAWVVVPLSSTTLIGPLPQGQEELSECEEDARLRGELKLSDEGTQRVEEQVEEAVARPRWARPPYEHLSTIDKRNITKAQWKRLDKEMVIELGVTARPKHLAVIHPSISDEQASLMYRGHDRLPHTIGSCFMLLGDEVSVNGQLQWKPNKV
jgi:hypothetical protein